MVAPPLWDAKSPWSACFLAGTLDTETYWEEHIRHPALAWLAAGRHGAPLSPEEESPTGRRAPAGC